jgi:hypothetical protein
MTEKEIAALEAGRNLLASYIDECGGCDHSVGICDESDRLILERMDEVLVTLVEALHAAQ